MCQRDNKPTKEQKTAHGRDQRKENSPRPPMFITLFDDYTTLNKKKRDDFKYLPQWPLRVTCYNKDKAPVLFRHIIEPLTG